VLVLVGRALGPEDRMDELGISLSSKGERWLGHQRFGEIQFLITWKMALEFVSPSRRIVGTSVGLKNMEGGGIWM